MPCLGLDPQGAVNPYFKNLFFSLNVQIDTMKYLLNSEVKMANLKRNHTVYYRLTGTDARWTDRREGGNSGLDFFSATK